MTSKDTRPSGDHLLAILDRAVELTGGIVKNFGAITTPM